MKKLLLISLLIWTTAVHAAAGIKVGDDWSSISAGSNMPLPWFGGSNTLATIVSSPTDGCAAHSSTKQAEVGWSGSGGSTITTGHISMAGLYNNEFLIDLWACAGNSVAFDQGEHMFYFLDNPTNSSWLLTNGGGSGGNNLNFSVQPNGGLVANNCFFFNPAHGVHHYQWYFNLSTTTVTQWVDGTPLTCSQGTMPITNGINNFKWDDFALAANHSPPATSALPQNWYISNVQIFTDTGTGTCTGTMAAGTISCSGGGGGGTSPFYLPIRHR